MPAQGGWLRAIAGWRGIRGFRAGRHPAAIKYNFKMMYLELITSISCLSFRGAILGRNRNVP